MQKINSVAVRFHIQHHDNKYGVQWSSSRWLIFLMIICLLSTITSIAIYIIEKIIRVLLTINSNSSSSFFIKNKKKYRANFRMDYYTTSILLLKFAGKWKKILSERVAARSLWFIRLLARPDRRISKSKVYKSFIKEKTQKIKIFRKNIITSSY